MSYTFVNPYNFIPLEKKSPEREKSGRGEYTGVIHYSVLTRTPLFIPNTSSDDAFKMRTGKLKNVLEEHKSMDFFSYTDLSEMEESSEKKASVPVIPGSEMRGLIRSYFEILTNSCMSAAEDDSDDSILSKRTQEKFKPGLLRKEKNGSFMLFDASDYLVRTLGENNLRDDARWMDDDSHNGRRCYKQEKVREGQKVSFRPAIRQGRGVKPLAKEIDPDCGMAAGRMSGYFIKGEPGPQIRKNEKILKQQKHCAHVFAINNKSVGKTADLSSLERVLTIYDLNGESLYSEYRKELRKFKDKAEAGSFFPVYYSSAVKGYDMLSPACITREIYHNTIRKMLRDHVSCSEEGKLCPACRMFGTVVNNRKNSTSFSVSSRVRFSDMKLIGSFDPSAVYLPVTTLKELSSPKLQNLEFYVKRPDGAQFWTYDYYFLYAAAGGLKEYLPELNGRKFFWHQDIGNRIPPENTEPMPSSEMDQKTLDKYKRNMTIRPLQKNVEFSGEVFFENLTETELNELIFVLDCGEEGVSLSKRKHGYKLGSGKPYGLGSIATAVDGVDIVSYGTDHDRHRILRQVDSYGDRYRAPEFDKETLNHFRKMTDFSAVIGENITYPYPRKPGTGEEVFIYDWFTDNHRKYEKSLNAILKKKMPNNRSEMVYAQYLKPMEPFTQPTFEEVKQTSEANSTKNRTESGFVKNSVPGKGAVWIAPYKLNDSNMQSKLFEIHGSKINWKYERTEKNMLNQQLLQGLSERYDILLISQNLGLERDAYLLDFARKKFKKIYQSVSKKEGGKYKDFDWTAL